MSSLKNTDFSKLIVCVVIIANILFTKEVFDVFRQTGSEPAALIAGWFSFTGGELGILGKIKWEKIRKKEGANEYD